MKISDTDAKLQILDLSQFIEFTMNGMANNLIALRDENLIQKPITIFHPVETWKRDFH